MALKDMIGGLFEPLPPEEQARRDRLKAQRRREQAVAAQRQREREAERLAALPYFRVREVREVLVQAEDMKDAIALASAAFKEGQDSDHRIKWGKPFGVSGDTKGPITTVDIRAIEEENLSKVQGAHSRACGYQPHDHGIFCSVDCPTCGGE